VAFRFSKTIQDVPGTFLALMIGNITPGIGTFASMFGVLPDLKKIYRNVRDLSTHLPYQFAPERVCLTFLFISP